MPTVVVARCFLDGEYTTDEVEVCFVQPVVGQMRSALIQMFPRLDRKYTNGLGEPVDAFALVRDEDEHALPVDAVVRATDRIYLIPTIGC